MRLNLPIDVNDFNNEEYIDKRKRDNYYTINDLIIHDWYKAIKKETICYHCLEVYMWVL